MERFSRRYKSVQSEPMVDKMETTDPLPISDSRELGGSLDDIRAFCAVVDFGSISAAAGQRSETKGAVSRRVTRLEQRLATTLLARRPRAVSVTEEGFAFYDKAREALALLGDAAESASKARSEPQGHLRITAPVDFGLELLPPIISRFRRQHPQITVQLLLTSSVLDLTTHRIDLALRASSDLPDMDYRAAPLAANIDVHLYATPSYLAERGQPREPQDLLSHDLIVANDLMDAVALTLMSKGRVERIAMQPAVQTGGMASAFRIVLADGGIGPVPDVVAAVAINDGRLHPVLPHWTVKRARLHAITIAGHNAPARVRLFKEFLREELASLGATTSL